MGAITPAMDEDRQGWRWCSSRELNRADRSAGPECSIVSEADPPSPRRTREANRVGQHLGWSTSGRLNVADLLIGARALPGDIGSL